MATILRLGYHLSLFGGIILFTFVLFHAVPSDPARVILGPNASEEQIQALRHELGLDLPLAAQLGTYLQRVCRLDFGNSYVDRRPVTGEVHQKLFVTISLLTACGVLAILYVTSVVLVQFTARGRAIAVIDFLLGSTPTFFSGTVIALLMSRFYPFTSFSGTCSQVADVLYLLPPALVLSFFPMSTLSKVVRAEIDRIQGAAYIRTAAAFGVPQNTILFRFVLKNAMVPVVATVANQIPILFTGAFVVEVIFSIPGIGSLLIKSLLQRDFPMLEGIVILSGLVVVVIHLISELLYPIMDPRMRASHAASQGSI
jgi:peptide/nickel transport system permease protein